MARRRSWDRRVVSGPAVLRVRAPLDRLEAKRHRPGATANERETRTGRIRTPAGHRRAVTGQNRTVITRYRTVAAERETKAEGIRTLAGHRRAVTACDRAVITRNLQVQSDDRGLARLAISPVVG